MTIFTTRDYHENYLKLSKIFNRNIRKMFKNVIKEIEDSNITNKDMVLEYITIKTTIHTNITHDYSYKIDNFKEKILKLNYNSESESE